jgi:hypothetical protein
MATIAEMLEEQPAEKRQSDDPGHFDLGMLTDPPLEEIKDHDHFAQASRL